MIEAKTVRMTEDIKNNKRVNTLLPNVGDKVMYYALTSKRFNTFESGYGVVLSKIVKNYKTLECMFIVLDNDTKKEIEVMNNSKAYPDDIIAKVKDTQYAVYDSLKDKVLTESIHSHKADVEDFMTHKYGSDWRNKQTMYSIREIKISVL